MCRRTAVEPRIVRSSVADAHPEVRHRGAQALDADVGADLHHHLVGLQARLVRRRDVDDPRSMPGGRNGCPPRVRFQSRRIPGACCGGSRMPPCVVFTTGAVLSAASWIVLVRLRITCACCANNRPEFGDNSSSEAVACRTTERGRERREGRRRQHASIHEYAGGIGAAGNDRGNAGRLDDEFGLLTR